MRSFLSGLHDFGSLQISLVASQDKRIFLHCLSDGGIVFLCFRKAHVPADGHDFLHGKPDVTLNQHNGFFAVAERALIFYLIGLYGLPDKITLCVVFDLPSLGAGYFFSLVGLLVFRAFDIKIGFAEIMKQADDKFAEAEELKRCQLEIMEKISGFTAEQAKEQLMKSLEEELIHEKAIKIKEYEQQTKDEAEKKAQNIISLAIQRCASDYVAESTVSVVALPNDEMKGRIIGREGRNIRTLETVTGVDIIIDDTPEAITLSSFNPIRREVARIAMERLIQDGRIHPARIEEMVDKANREIEATIKEEGEHATL